MTVKFHHGGAEMLSSVKPMWEQLNLMNIGRSVHFDDHFKELDFETRMRPVISRAEKGSVLVTVASDEDLKEDVGYCVATIDTEHVAEVDSIFVKSTHRNDGIGGRMLDITLEWIDTFPVNRTFLSVTFGNEDAPRFYERHGFRPRMTIFERK
jgi:GNAT superfamily N-acetyltransferase